MSNDINLVSSKSEKIEKERKALRITKIIALVSLVTVAFLSVGIFFINFTLPIAAVRREQEQTLLQISSLSKKHASYNFIKDRLVNLNKVLGLRKDYAKSLNVIFSKIPSPLVITDVRIENGALVMAISGNSLLSINDVIESLIEFSENKKIISDLIIESLVFDPKTGDYNLNIKANII
ncbi:MAG: hypothetical protein COU25_00330 [Candidatus Levybacteria bacterium CG10_big_fil_rev_8_21_14_0_10_35_13]|nr:MAG: hypothetical protein COU25_00330 [Candidatus Levybacteria bacterium CG10_big_fil_rev_8_21_14_0_10_35_13]